MTLCVKTGYSCMCQPDEGVFCPDYKPDKYIGCLMTAITELIAESKNQQERIKELESERDAMQRRAESAESDMISAEAAERGREEK